eukprot:m.10559 g.10559  ORF g.10559 m.10559 type:complete len:121 (+) comp22416_c0_seq1:130-492(+)
MAAVLSLLLLGFACFFGSFDDVMSEQSVFAANDTGFNPPRTGEMPEPKASSSKILWTAIIAVTSLVVFAAFYILIRATRTYRSRRLYGPMKLKNEQEMSPLQHGSDSEDGATTIFDMSKV